MGVLCAFIGVLVGAQFMDSPGEGWQSFPLLAGLSAFASGTLCWLVFVARHLHPSIVRGALAGVSAALIAHHGSFYLMLAEQNISYWVYGTVSSLGEAPLDLVGGIVGVAPLTFFSYLFVGWFTIPAGAAIGGLYARHLSKR